MSPDESIAWAKVSPLTSPLLIRSTPIPIEKATVTELLAALDIPGNPGLVLETHPRNKLRHGRIRIHPHVAAVAYYRGSVYAIASCDAVVTAQVLGGRYAHLVLTPHTPRRMQVGGVDLYCVAVLRAATEACGPIFCKDTRQPQQLHESEWPAMRASQDWCAPVTDRGVLVCARCKAHFRIEDDLFEHGNIPRPRRQRLRHVLPPDWHPIPPDRIKSPVSATNLECGSLNDRHHGYRRRRRLESRLIQLSSPPRHHPYRIPLTLGKGK